MIIATWNINSVRVRTEQLRFLLQSKDIDIVLLQEIKCVTEAFPSEIFENLGYNCAVFGQKAHNGVAILAKYKIEDIRFGNSVFINDPSARYIEAFIKGYKVASVYVPNGQAPNSPQYFYKLDFLNTLITDFTKSIKNEKFIIGGDFNITRSDLDVYDPQLWKGAICCTDAERSKFASFLEIGFIDKHREMSGNDAIYTWWDYRTFGFKKGNGLRLDYMLTTENIMVNKCYVSLETRALERPSDHAPVIIEIK
ncbi:MAG: exodeoxyribonuclease III [Holosporales bacterium]|jgi:exodeoxyribonuclease-3|nr:exodeoxyribonuclease III [Holosporales bacterium]